MCNIFGRVIHFFWEYFIILFKLPGMNTFYIDIKITVEIIVVQYMHIEIFFN